MARWVLLGVIVLLVGQSALSHAEDAAATSASPSAASETPKKAGQDQASTDESPPVDEELLEHMDVLLELKVLDSLETIEALQAVGEEDEP